MGAESASRAAHARPAKGGRGMGETRWLGPWAEGRIWAIDRRGKRDRFDNLYRSGLRNRILWKLGAWSTLVWF